MKPRLAPGVRVRPDPRDAVPVLLSPERGLRLSETAAVVVDLCDGTRTVEQMVDLLAERYGDADRARIRSDMLGLLVDLRARGVIEGFEERAGEDEGVSAGAGESVSAGVGESVSAGEGAARVGAGEHPRQQVRRDRASAADAVGRRPVASDSPYTLVAELTHRCPLACPYCSNPRELVRGHDELTTDEWLRVLDDATSMGVMQVHLSGGEPLARADLEAVASRARARDLYVNLVTSGVPLARTRLESLAPSLDHVQLSVQDASALPSDRIASCASFEQKMLVAQWVKEIGLPLTVNVVLHRQNLDRIDDIIAMAERLGADRLELANVQFVSWALENRPALLPSLAQIERARVSAAQASCRLEGRMQVVFVLPDWHADRPRACMDGWGRRFVVVAPDGAVLPCHAARSLPLTFESVRARPLRTLWEESEALRAFRGEQWMPEPCKSCDRRAIDFGGCRCQAFALTGDARATDPACPLSPRHELIRAAREEAEGGGERRLLFRGRAR